MLLAREDVMNTDHVGYIVGCNASIRNEYRRKVLLRETKDMWIAEHGAKFNKRTLHMVCVGQPIYKLESEPVKQGDR